MLKSMHRPSTAIRLATFIAVIAGLVTAAQSGFILLRGDSFCLNDGCRVVENLTRIPPLAVNLAGVLFFLTVWWGLRTSRSRWRRLPRFVGPLLLAGLAVEGVLFGFQLFAAQAFCSYCLAILAAVVVLNLLLGLRQIATGLVIFLAALLAFAGLDLQHHGQSASAFRDGVFAKRAGSITSSEHHLFYSSSCAHCEQVIAALRTNSTATVLFHPIDEVTNLNLAGTVYSDHYNFDANRALLTALDLDEIPVLITTTKSSLTVLRGKAAIMAGLSRSPLPTATGGQSSVPTASPVPGLPPEPGEQGCQMATDCGDLPAATSLPAVP